MGAVRSLCKRGFLLKEGRIVYSGDIEKVVGHYVSDPCLNGTKSRISWALKDAPGKYGIKLQSIEILPLDANENSEIKISSGISIVCRVVNSGLTKSLIDLGIEILTHENVKLIRHSNFISASNSLKKGVYVVRMGIPPYLLNKGLYKLKVWLGLNTKENLTPNIPYLTFEVQSEKIDHISKEMPGVLRPKIDYKVVHSPNEGVI